MYIKHQPNLTKIERFRKVRYVWGILSEDSREKLRKMDKMGPPLLSPRMCIRTFTNSNADKQAKVNKLVSDLYNDLTVEKQKYKGEIEISTLVTSYKQEIEKCVASAFYN